MTYDEERALAQVASEAITEMRRRRRWRIFFRLFWLVIILAFFARSFFADGEQHAFPKTTPHIAKVEVEGIIATGAPANADDLNEALQDAFANPSAQAVIISINSPGGSPVQAGQVYRQILHLKQKYPKPVYAVINDIGASGAYYIAAAADDIYADPASIVGSIGVISQSIGVVDLIDKLGIEARTFKSGKYKDFLNPAKPLDGDEAAHMQGVLTNVHAQFIDAVKAGRGDRLANPEKNNLFTGLFWSGQQALELGLIDGLASARELVDKKYDTDTDIVLYTPELSPWEQISRDLRSEVGQRIDSLLGVQQQIGAVLGK